MSTVIHTAVFRDNIKGKALKAGVSFYIDDSAFAEPMQAETISTERTYGELWLERLHFYLSKLVPLVSTERHTFKLITGDETSEKMANKIQRALLDVISRDAKPSIKDAEHAVLKLGRYYKRANDDLYAKVVLLLWESYRSSYRIMFEHCHVKNSPTTWKLMQKLHADVAPHKQLLKTKPTKAPL